MTWESAGDLGPGTELERMSRNVVEMLEHARHLFVRAVDALLDDAVPLDLADELLAGDRRINELERGVRRELVVHTSLHGTEQMTAVLVVLMVSRKAERIGDNATNIFDLVTYGVDLSEADDPTAIRAARDEVSDMIWTAREIFRTWDRERGTAFLQHSRQLERQYDDVVAELVRSRSIAQHAVPRALLYRYLKRIVANLEGVVAGVVQPLDLIDYSPTGEEESET